MTETRDLRNALTGVSVVTTKTRHTMVGHTVSAISPVSDEPPTLMLAIPRGEALATAIEERRAFAVNVLADHQAGLAETFAAAAPTFPIEDWWPFDSLPRLQDAAAHFECRVEHTHESGAHLLVVGRVVKGSDPLGTL